MATPSRLLTPSNPEVLLWAAGCYLTLLSVASIGSVSTNYAFLTQSTLSSGSGTHFVNCYLTLLLDFVGTLLASICNGSINLFI